MNKKGFTLIELLAVIIILAVTFLFVTPKLIQLINEGKETNKQITNEIVIDAVNRYLTDNGLNNNFYEAGDTYTLSAEVLVRDGYLKEDEIDGISDIVIELQSDDSFSYTISTSD